MGLGRTLTILTVQARALKMPSPVAYFARTLMRFC
jgi:hypothetical protein